MSDDVWSVVVIVALAGWITSTLFFIFKVFPARDRFEVKPARLWGALMLFFFAAWIAGLLNA